LKRFLYRRPGNQLAVTVVFSHTLPGWTVILAQSPRCRRGKGCVLWRSSRVCRSACSLDSSYVDPCRPPIVLHVPGANSVPSRPLISSSRSTGWDANTMWQSLLVVVTGPSFFVRAGWCRPPRPQSELSSLQAADLFQQVYRLGRSVGMPDRAPYSSPCWLSSAALRSSWAPAGDVRSV